jgi:hypothetical protein
MTIWGALLIPVIAVFVLLFFFQHRTKWWEVGIPLLASALMIGGFKYMAESLGTKDMEIWNGWTVQARYYEPWDEYIHQTCTMCVGYDKDGFCNSEVTYDCSYVSNHSPYWEITDSNGDEHSIDESTYQHFVRLFGHAPIFKDMGRNYHSYDGDRYHVNWPKTEPTVEPVNVAYNYENRVQASRSVFNYVRLSDQEVTDNGIFEYPEVKLFNYPSVLGDCGPTTKEGNERLRFHNSMLGKEKQLRMWILCTRSADPGWGQLQESHWVGGNKNEAVLVIGDGWDHVFTWADDKTPLIETRDFVKAKLPDLDMVQVSDVMARNLEEGFVRKRFAEFSYLTIEPPRWSVILTYVITLLINGGLSYFIIVNAWDDDQSRSRWARRNWRH